VEAEEVAQIYLSDREVSTVVPLHSLIGLRRAYRHHVHCTPQMTKMVNDARDRVLEPGSFRVTVGGCSPSERGVRLSASAPISMAFTVTRKI